MSIQIEETITTRLPTATRAVGIDLGVATFAALSDNTHIAGIDAFRAHEKKLV